MQEAVLDENLLNLSLDYRVALAHSPIDPKNVLRVTAGWLKEGENEVHYGFVLWYRGRWVYLYGGRYPKQEVVTHSMQWFDIEPVWLYKRHSNWRFDISEALTRGAFFSDQEAGRPTPAADNYADG